LLVYCWAHSVRPGDYRTRPHRKRRVRATGPGALRLL